MHISELPKREDDTGGDPIVKTLRLWSYAVFMSGNNKYMQTNAPINQKWLIQPCFQVHKASINSPAENHWFFMGISMRRLTAPQTKVSRISRPVFFKCFFKSNSLFISRKPFAKKKSGTQTDRTPLIK